MVGGLSLSLVSGKCKFIQYKKKQAIKNHLWEQNTNFLTVYALTLVTGNV